MDSVFKEIISVIFKGPKAMVVVCTLLISLWFFGEYLELAWLLATGLSLLVSALCWMAYDFVRDKIYYRKENKIASIYKILDAEIQIRAKKARDAYGKKSFNKAEFITEFNILVDEKIDVVKSLKAAEAATSGAVSIIEEKRDEFAREIGAIGPHAWLGN